MTANIIKKNQMSLINEDDDQLKGQKRENRRSVIYNKPSLLKFTNSMLQQTGIEISRH
jgi:hypothetical protein